ncbi:MAG: hypothetical protein EPN38_09160 [Rhodanobacteraceae bacterium]|nr:MAG: hypothetical protein EPN38_09160 [Rhodanobacteraceae bacterium]
MKPNDRDAALSQAAGRGTKGWLALILRLAALAAVAWVPPVSGALRTVVAAIRVTPSGRIEARLQA